MADQTISLELQIDAVDSAKTIADFKNAINDLKAALAATGSNFDGFAQGATKVSDAENKVNSLTTAIGGVANAGDKIDAVANVGKNIAAGFSAAKSAADLLGASGDELKKTLAGISLPGNTANNADANQLAAYKQYAEETNAITMQIAQTKIAQSNSASQIEMANDQKVNNAKREIATDTLSAISNIADAFAGKSVESQKKAFEVNKQASAANALISTYEAATKAYSALAGVPVVGPELAVVAAGAAIAAGLANVAKIESQQFDGGSSSGSSSSVSASAGAPSLQPSFQPTTSLPNNNQNTQTGKQQPLKVFVTESDIRNATNRIDTITGRAVIH